MPAVEKVLRTNHRQANRKLQDCLSHCLNAYRICTEAATHCLNRGRELSAAKNIRIILDTAEICRATASLMMHQSELHLKICEICAEILDLCAENCEEFEDDIVMLNCAEICRQSALACRTLSFED